MWRCVFLALLLSPACKLLAPYASTAVDAASPAAEGLQPASDGQGAADLTDGSAADSTPSPLPPFSRSGRVVSKSGWAWENPWPQGNTLRSIWGAAPNAIWAVGDRGTLLTFDGATWRGVANAFGDVNLRAVAGTGSDNVWVVGDGGAILRRDQAKHTFVRVDAGPDSKGTDLLAVAVASRTVAVAGKTGTFRFRNLSTGSKWAKVVLPSTLSVSGVAALANDHFIAVGAKGEIYEIVGGVPKLLKPPSIGLNAVSTNGKTTVAVGDQGRVVTLVGGKPKETSIGAGIDLVDVAVLPSGATWALSRGGTLFSNWSQAAKNLPGALGGIWAESATRVWLTGARGSIVLHDKGRLHAVSHDIAAGVDLNDVWADAGERLIVGAHGLVLFQQGSQPWRRAPNLRDDLFGVFSSPRASLAVVVGDNGAFWIRDASGTWSPHRKSTFPLTDVWMVGKEGWASSIQSGEILHSVGKTVSVLTIAATGSSRTIYVPTTNFNEAWVGGPTGARQVGNLGPAITGGVNVIRGTSMGLWAAGGKQARTLTGNVWTSVASMPSVEWRGLSAVITLPTDVAYFVGAGGTIVAASQGSMRSTFASPTSATLTSVWAVDRDDVWAVGQGGVILHYKHPSMLTSL